MMYVFRSCLLSPDEAICPVSADLLKFYFPTLHFKYVVSGLKLDHNCGQLTFFFVRKAFQSAQEVKGNCRIQKCSVPFQVTSG